MRRRLAQLVAQGVCRARAAARDAATAEPWAVQSLQRRAASSGSASGGQTSSAGAAAARRGGSGGAPRRHAAFEPPGQQVPLTPQELAARERRNYLIGAALLGAAGATYYITVSRPADVAPPGEAHLVNWSGTHECHTRLLHQPESLPELEALVQRAHKAGARWATRSKLRCVGSGLSPNGLGFNQEGMVSLALMDKILSVDQERGLVTVQAGARVQDVADQLRPHGLTLANFASIREQTVGGFTQVSAHGTGAGIPPVDEQVVGLKLVTPALGTLELSRDKDADLFNLARVGLGCLGVVAEVTLQCVPAHRLVERTSVASRSAVRKNHACWLGENKHLRYMWIPSTDAVVVVTNNELPQGEAEPAPACKYDEAQRLQPLRALLQSRSALPAEEVAGLSATQCRDALLALGPLDPDWVARVNAAEAEHWRRSEGVRVGWSDELLGFDCGGQQWVLEVAFPAGTAQRPDGADLRYMEDLLKAAAKAGVPAPSPIEQRWTAGSGAPMSPAFGPPGSLFSWVGIIMYLPEDAEQRQAVTASFRQYAKLVEQQLMPKYNAVEHWAKIEVPQDPAELASLQQRLAARYPVAAFNAVRQRLDPHNILGSPMVEALFPRASPQQQEQQQA